eukprot:TRINITY_DN35788_c0_g1_i1.p1 TRINITY_DN35788_c0_g1~~TRINITY_DN35788_c0_g1_i1.p1  ORF type:complete len:250 (+),score=46.54 TRINITY_DN35788_c0_g1_i1:1-750(+)
MLGKITARDKCITLTKRIQSRKDQDGGCSARLQARTFVMKAGDAIFIPSYWIHHTEALSGSISAGFFHNFHESADDSMSKALGEALKICDELMSKREWVIIHALQVVRLVVTTAFQRTFGKKAISLLKGVTLGRWRNRIYTKWPRDKQAPDPETNMICELPPGFDKTARKKVKAAASVIVKMLLALPDSSRAVVAQNLVDAFAEAYFNPKMDDGYGGFVYESMEEGLRLWMYALSTCGEGRKGTETGEL